jgi:hypothetical protein
MALKGKRNDGWQGIFRSPSKRRSQGDLLFGDTFSDHGRPTFNHWRQHYAGQGTSGAPVIPPGLTRYPSLDSYALVLSTPDKGISQTPSSQRGFGSYKNLSRWFTEDDAGLVTFSAYITTMVGRVAPGASWSIGIDTQKWGSSPGTYDRSFFKLSCQYVGGVNGALWYLVNNAGTAVPLKRPDGSDTSGSTAGLNQNKANFNYVELTVDLSSNGGRGKYVSCQINNMVLDLTDTNVWADSTQSGQQSTQGLGLGHIGSTSEYLLDYSGGLNFGVFGSMPNNDGAYPFRLFVSRPCATIYGSGN